MCYVFFKTVSCVQGRYLQRTCFIALVFVIFVFQVIVSVGLALFAVGASFLVYKVHTKDQERYGALSWNKLFSKERSLRRCCQEFDRGSLRVSCQCIISVCETEINNSLWVRDSMKTRGEIPSVLFFEDRYESHDECIVLRCTQTISRRSGKRLEFVVSRVPARSFFDWSRKLFFLNSSRVSRTRMCMQNDTSTLPRIFGSQLLLLSVVALSKIG